MKCVNCGAELGLDVLKCPYCGTDNEVAKSRAESLLKLQEHNEEFAEKVIKESRAVIWYRLHKRINLAMFLVGVIIFGGLFCISHFTEDSRREEHEAQLLAYYETGQLEEIYWYMNEKDLWGEGYDYGAIAFIWSDYNESKQYFSKAYEHYVNTGYYKASDLKFCITFAANVLVKYEWYSEKGKDMSIVKPYRDEMLMMLTGILKVPNDLIEELEFGKSKKEEPIVEYVLGVLPNEE